MSLIKKGLPLSGAAAKAAMDEKTARKYRDAERLPCGMKKTHAWRTRPDPFAKVWPKLVLLLEKDSGLQAKTIFEELQRQHPGCYPDGQIRTFQRRVRLWRAFNGPEREVFFSQVYRPGEQCQSDFTEMNSLKITIAGEPFEHIAYHFVLPYSNWEFVDIAFSESFEALSEGLQGALWTLGVAPFEHRTDCLSAATHELRYTRGRGFNERYLELLDYYDMKPSKISPGKANEIGDVEQSHNRFKTAVDQRLRLRGSRDFPYQEDYLCFLKKVIASRNGNREVRLWEELVRMNTLPLRKIDSFREEPVKVTRWSTVRLLHNVYSVPSRLIGYRLRARIHACHIELEYGCKVVHRMERLRGEGKQSIDYRHLIHSLIRKPGAFRRFAYREALFPSVVFRKAYDSLVEKSEKWADLQYLQILYLAATTFESTVEEALAKLLEEGTVPEYEIVKALVAPVDIKCPDVEVTPPDLSTYDQLLKGEEVLV